MIQICLSHNILRRYMRNRACLKKTQQKTD